MSIEQVECDGAALMLAYVDTLLAAVMAELMDGDTSSVQCAGRGEGASSAYHVSLLLSQRKQIK